MENTKENTGALAGVTILDMSRLLPGPYCSMILADHGARVIAMEDKRFQADNLFIHTVNRNKEHIALNLKTDAGKEIFMRLVRRVDVVLEGFRPGVVERLGVGYEAVKKINPRVIYCAITGYGQDGPFRDRVGHDVNYLSEAGVLNLIGSPDRPPTIPGVQIADLASGGMNAVIGVILALYARERTGKGQYIDISMTDGSVGLMPLALYFQQLVGEEPPRGNWMLSHRYACYNTYETADGRCISIGAVEYRFWKTFCDYLEKPEYAPLQYDDGKRREIIDFVRETFKKKTLVQWEAELEDLAICWGRVNTLADVLEAPLFRERGMVVDMEDREGKTIPAIGVPVKMSDTPGSIRTPPVSFGESTVSILEELEYTENQIQAFTEQGAI